MILGIQIIGILFGLFMIYYTFMHYKRKEFKAFESIFWIVCWLLFIGVTIYPASLDFMVRTLNISRRLDLLTIVGFMFLIAISIYNYTQNKRNLNRIETVVRNTAIKMEEEKND